MNESPVRGKLGDAGAPDERLSALLRRWSAIEPGPGFEANVWRRIRFESAIRPGTVWGRWSDRVLGHPAWTGAAAAAVALAFGLLAGRVRSHGHETHPLLHPQTLMGTYLWVSEGGRR